MQLTNEFRVGVPVEHAWTILTDVERIAPCLPGAQLQEVEGDQYRGIVKVKVGPITAQYKGTATFVEQDLTARRVVLKAEGRDIRGQGNATATVTATLAADGDGTAVRVVTDLTITGKVAQFGRGVLADVSGKLIGQFVANLERDVLDGAQGPERRGAPTAAAARAPGPSPGTAAERPAAPPPAPAGGRSAAWEELAPMAPSAGEGSPPADVVASHEAAGGQKRATRATTTSAVAGGPTEDGPSAAAGTNGAAASGTNGAAPAGPAPASTVAPAAVRRIDSPEAQPVDLLVTAGSPVAKRLLPAVVALLGLGVLWRLLTRHRRG